MIKAVLNLLKDNWRVKYKKLAIEIIFCILVYMRMVGLFLLLGCKIMCLGQCYKQKYNWVRPKLASQRNDTIILDSTQTTFNGVYDFDKVHVFFDRQLYYNNVNEYVEENPDNDTALFLFDLVKKAFDHNALFNPVELCRHIDFKSLDDEYIDPLKFVLELMKEGMCQLELDGCMEKNSFIIVRTRIWWGKYVSHYYMANGIKITRTKEKLMPAKF